MLFPDPPTLAHYTLTATTPPPSQTRVTARGWGNLSLSGAVCHLVLCGQSSPPWVPGVRGLCCEAAHLPALALLNLILHLYQGIWETGS